MDEDWGSTHFRRPNRGYLQTLGMWCGLASYYSACFPSRKEDRSPFIERSPLFHPDVICERRVVGVLYWVSINWINRVSPHELQICKQIFAVNNSDKNFGQHPSCFSPSFMRNSLRDDPVDHAMHFALHMIGRHGGVPSIKKRSVQGSHCGYVPAGMIPENCKCVSL